MNYYVLIVKVGEETEAFLVRKESVLNRLGEGSLIHDHVTFFKEDLLAIEEELKASVLRKEPGIFVFAVGCRTKEEAAQCIVWSMVFEEVFNAE